MNYSNPRRILMAVNSSFHLHMTIIILLCFPLFPSPASSRSIQHRPSHPPRGQRQGVLIEEKMRLGSTPPSCYNKCNQCHPCMPVRVPTLVSLRQVQFLATGSGKNSHGTMGSLAIEKSSVGNARYSNYKLLDWKCHCDDHFYNP